RVIEDADLDALAGFLLQQRGELVGHLALLEDVGLEVDVVARGEDRRLHRLVRCRAVEQQLDPVARNERTIRRARLRLVGRRHGAAAGNRQREAQEDLTRISFLTDRTPCTFFAACAARLACCSESAKPESSTTPP